MRGGQVDFTIDLEAQFVEIRRPDAGPAVEYRGLDVAHAGVLIDADAVLQHLVDGDAIAFVVRAVIAFGRQDDPDVNAAAARPGQFEQDQVVGKIGIFNHDIALRAADRLELRAIDLRIMGCRVQHPKRVAIIVGMLVFAVQHLEKACEIAEHARLGPGLVGVVLQVIDDRSADFHHQVVPVVAVFAADVHAADERQFLVDDRRLGVVAGRPGNGATAEFNLGILLQVLPHVQRTDVAFRQRLGIRLGSDHVAECIDQDADVDVFRLCFQRVGDVYRVVIVIEYVGADVD